MTFAPMMTAEEVATLMRCSVLTVEEYARAGRLPGIKPGGSWMFPTDALIRAVNRMAEEEAARRSEPTKPAAVKVKQAGNKPVNLKLLTQQSGGQVLAAQ